MDFKILFLTTILSLSRNSIEITREKSELEALKFFPNVYGLEPIRRSHYGLLPEASYNDAIHDDCGHKYLLEEYDTNGNYAIDTYYYYSLNINERIYTQKGFLWPNLVFRDEDEKSNMEYMWEFTDSTGIFKKYEPYKP